MIDYGRYNIKIVEGKTAADYRRELGGGISLSGGLHIPLVIDCFIETAEKTTILAIEDIGRMFDIYIIPLLRSPEKCQKIAIVNEILYRFPDSKRKETRFKDGRIKRGVLGVKIKKNIPTPSEILIIFFQIIKEKVKIQEFNRLRKNQKLKDIMLLKNYDKRMKKEAEKALLPEKPKTIYDIIGPCPGEDKKFSAFDYIRKQPLEGWDTPEKREWFLKIRREILREGRRD